MAVLLYCHLLLLMGGVLSIVSSAPSDDSKTGQKLAAPLPWWKQPYQGQDNAHCNGGKRYSVASYEEAGHEENFNTMVRDKLQGTAQVDEDEPPKKKAKLEKDNQLHAGLLHPKCNKDSDCGPGNQCCHVPGSASRVKTCVKADKPQSNPSIYKAADFFPRHSDKNALEIHTLPIGQGDCTVIYCPGGKNAVLFDCGSTAGGDNRLSPDDVKKFFEKVDHIAIIISHGDQDHYNFLPRIFNVNQPLFSKIKQVITGGPASDCSCARSGIQEWLKVLGTKVVSTGPGDPPFFGDKNLCNDPSVHFEFIAAGSKGAKNERSVVMKLSRDNNPSSILFTGDMEGNVAKKLAVTHESDLRSSHYKITHHGASTIANKPDWLKAISPVEAYVSHAYIAQYGHPRCEAINNLLTIGSLGTKNLLTRHHPFTCVKKMVKGRPPEIDSNDICHRIFSTSPTADTICVIKLSFLADNSPATTELFCDKVANWKLMKGADEVVVCPKASVDDDDDL